MTTVGSDVAPLLDDGTPPLLSVVIPVYNDSDRLASCLEALGQQTYPRSRFEVIVIDNGSDADRDPRSVCLRFPFVKFASTQTPGSYAARNLGVQMCRGPLIAFTDADCIPAAEWLERGVAHLARLPNCGLLAGRIDVFAADERRPNAVEIYEKAVAFGVEEAIKGHRYGLTANLIAPRTSFDRVGLFNEGIKSGGDAEWGQRVDAAGLALRYEADVVVAHPALATFAALRKKAQRHAGGTYDRRVRPQTEPWRRAAQLVKLLARELVAIVGGPPFHLLLDNRVHGGSRSLRFAGVCCYVAAVRLAETVRLQFGKESERG